MTWYGLSVFSLAYVLAVAIPGPGVAAIIARSLGHGLRGAPGPLWTAPAKAMDASAEVGRERPGQLFLGSLAFGASRARRFFSTPKTVRWVQRGTGVAMASAAVAVATT
jgi:threonine/homoserine/homoserine lactone efflux protein